MLIGLQPLIFKLFFKNIDFSKVQKRHSTMPELSEWEKKINYASSVTFFGIVAYSLFLPIKYGTVWFYTGLIVYLVGMIFGFLALIYFGNALLDKPVTNGVYSISRNPMYFSMLLIFIGISITSASWLFLLFTIMWFILSDRIVLIEERWCLETYGEDFREYMNTTPKWIGIPKSKKE